MTSYAGKENQCRNFSPNIFNKNKCQNCFKPRETHLLSDKDLNKATPIYCGWLLLAPIGTDFDNPMHRARKWQRRYFILFEHGALRYALDDNANTLPQGTINMNQCTDVVHAEKMTGQKYSLCIYHPEMKYFIRSESRDDTTGWLEQLIVFPETVKRDALNKKRLARRFGSHKSPSPVPMSDEPLKRASSVSHDALRSQRVESPRLDSPRERMPSPEPAEEGDIFHDRITSPTMEKRANTEIRRGRSISRKSTDMKQGTQTTDRPLRRAKSLDRDAHDMNDITVEALNQKKGWLLRRSSGTKETWIKHWFVLAANVLKYYPDPSAEEFSHPDCEISIDGTVEVTEVEVNRNYGFSVKTTSEEIILAAVTSGIRRNWMRAIEKPSESANEKDAVKQDSEKENNPVIFDEKMVETTMQRRKARLRLRRKTGRSRTYDFAELKSVVPATVDVPPPMENKSAELELHKPIEKSDLKLPLEKENQEVVHAKENGVASPELHRKEEISSPRTASPRIHQQTESNKSTRKLPLTSEMLDQVDGRWERIEKFDIFSQILGNSKSGNKSHGIIENSSSAAVCNSLKSEVDIMEKQMEQSKREFADCLNEHNHKVESDALKGAGNSKMKIQPVEDAIVTYTTADSDRIRALEIQNKCAMDENKRLRDEIVQSRLTSEKESSRMQAKIKELRAELKMVSKRSRNAGKAGLKSEKTERSFKDKVSELEAEMEDTGQMIAARLTALETPRRKETDDSDEAGSSSSCSSINQLTKQSKGDEERGEIRKKALDLDSSHHRLGESIKNLQDARSSSEFGTTAVQEAFNMNKATVMSLQRKLLEDRKKWSSVKKTLQELRGKVTEIQHDKHTDPQHVLPLLESVLDDTLQVIEKGGVSDGVNIEPSHITLENAKKKARVRDSKELERVAVEKIKTLSEQLKINAVEGELKRSLASSTSSSTTSLVEVQNPLDKLPLEQREKLFAEQLSHEAMIVAEMAGTLERYAGGKNSDIAQSLLHSDTQDIFPENGRHENQSSLLQRSGIVAEKLLLESRLMKELSRLQSTSNLQHVRHEFKSSSLPPSGSFNKTSQENWSRGIVGDTASLSLIQAQVNYMLHVYNDRIARLSHDVKEAQHRADVFQQKLHELVHACKTRDIELVSQLAVEVDTKASLALTVEDLPEWRQQVDYGMLHGAQASISNIDLRVEASFFSKLSEDISCMSSDSSSLAGIGARLLELDMSLSRAIKPSVIGDHASIIAYEAISQAQLLFLSRRITKDYEEEIIKMKSAVRKQAAHCENLEQKLRDIENGDATKVQELTKEHKQKVERLVQQLALVEQARKEMSAEMDQKLNKLSQRQQREMERSEARHREETQNLKKELDKSQVMLEDRMKEHGKEVNMLKSNLRDSKKHHEEQIEEVKRRYEDELSEEKRQAKKKIDSISSGDAEKMAILKAEFEEKLKKIAASHEEEMAELEKQRTHELNRLEEKYEREIEKERAGKEKALRDAEVEFEESLKEKQSLLHEIQQEKSEETKVQHDMQMSELQDFFEQSFSDFEQAHKRELEEMAIRYQEDVKRLEEEKAREMDEDVTSTRKAITSMKNHYQDELDKLKGLQAEALEQSPELETQVEDLRRELETLSELYTKKCVEMSDKEEEIKTFEERLAVSEKNTQVLKEQNEQLSNEIEEKMKSTSMVATREEESDDINHLKVELGAKKLQVSILQQQMKSLKQHVAMTLEGRGFLRHGARDTLKIKGYDIMKSKSQPDFISLEEMSMKTVGRRSSDRRSKVNQEH